MFQFARLLTLQGDQRETSAWAGEVTAYVNANTDLEVSLWGAAFGHPVGTVAWSSMVEGRAQLFGEQQKLLADGAYLDLVAKAQDWVSAPAEDIFRSFVHGNPPEEPPAVGAVAAVTQAVAATGKMPEAMAWATGMADHASSVIGSPVGLFANAYGDFGGFAFITLQPDMAAVDASTDAVRTDAGYMERIAASAGLFVEGSAHQSLLTRLA